MSVLCQARSLEYSNDFLIDSNISGCLKTVTFLQKKSSINQNDWQHKFDWFTLKPYRLRFVQFILGEWWCHTAVMTLIPAYWIGLSFLCSWQFPLSILFTWLMEHLRQAMAALKTTAEHRGLSLPPLPCLPFLPKVYKPKSQTATMAVFFAFQAAWKVYNHGILINKKHSNEYLD